MTKPAVHSATWEAIDRLMAARVPQREPGDAPAALRCGARADRRGPLCQAAAQRLVDAIKPGDPVLLTTGAGGPPWLFKGETDGPLGLAGLARALTLGCGAWPVIMTEERSKHPVEMTLAAAGVSLLSEDMARVRPTTATLVDFPIDPAEAEQAAGAFLDRYKPAAMITIEKTSPNRRGVIHSVSGQAWTRQKCVISFASSTLVAECRRRGILTIGIGDHGNEMGFGLIEDTVRKTVPRADVCQCPCGQGMASSVTTDIVIPRVHLELGCLCHRSRHRHPEEGSDPDARRYDRARDAAGLHDGGRGRWHNFPPDPCRGRH